ncbi:NAD(P)H-hydrate dehydratase [Methylophilus sp. 5]|uniref:NAD(P)H-hydrate dehydratase n=1 Tax=Methylophilus sp. 5 TaxID=1112274 RepID=UPI0004907865|nr:NAD(P)H-hydrate dehydratase [Methylophilus sp. 5]
MQTETANHPALWQHLLPKPDATSHKYRRGYALIQGGYPITGAARLAALAAARVGAGLTAIAVPELALAIYASQLLSIMAKPYSNQAMLDHLIAEPRISAYLIGPGAGSSDQTRATTLNMLRTGKPVVLDADALTTFARQTALLKQNITAPCVCTPHDGEFAALLGVQPSSQLAQRIVQTQQAAQALNAVVLLKGAQTIIAATDGRIAINHNAPPSLATAGAGDVLAGLITGLLAQGMPAFEASAAAAWIHGRAATLFGPGLIADDLPALIPAVLRELT